MASQGTVVQAEVPLWRSLELVIGPDLAHCFMWMNEVRLADGTRVDAYKHVVTRRYLHLDPVGRAYVCGATGRYVPRVLAAALREVFDGWERARPATSELDLFNAALHRAGSATEAA